MFRSQIKLTAPEAIMHTTQIGSLKYDLRHPRLLAEDPANAARNEWLYNATEDLLRASNVSFQRRMRKPQGVTADEFALAVDEYVNNRLADSEITTPALGWLLITAARGNADRTAIAELLGHSEHPLGKLGEIAETLLLPLVEDALIAHTEDS